MFVHLYLYNRSINGKSGLNYSGSHVVLGVG